MISSLQSYHSQSIFNIDDSVSSVVIYQKKFSEANIVEFSDPSWKTYFQKLSFLLSKILINSLSYSTLFITEFSNLFFLSFLNNSKFYAAYGLGSSWTNVFGTAMIICFFEGFLNQASQLFGQRNYKELGIVYQRSQFIGLGIPILSFIFLFFCEDILVAFQIEPEIAQMATKFCFQMFPTLLFSVFYESTRLYLYAQGIFYIPFIVSLICSFLNIILTCFFVLCCNMEIRGIALSKNIATALSYIILHFIIVKKDLGKGSWFSYTKEAFLFEKWNQFKICAIAGLPDYMKWIILEIIVFLIGLLKNTAQLAAHTTFGNLTSFTVAFIISNYLTINSVVGNAVGSGSAKKIKNLINLSLVVCGILGGTLTIVLLLVKSYVIDLFATDSEMRKYFNLVYCCYLCGAIQFEFFQTSLGAILKTLDKEKLVLKTFLIGYASIIPTGMFFGIYLQFGLLGFQFGIVSTPIFISLFLFWKLRYLNIEQIASKKIHLIDKISEADEKNSEHIEMFELSYISDSTNSKDHPIELEQL